LRHDLQLTGRRGDRVRWIEKCSDPELDWCLRHARAVLYPSSCEGYGLPVAEAASVGATVIASDTVVHREVVRGLQAGSDVRLCPPDAHALADQMEHVLRSAPRTQAVTNPRTWRDATRDLLQAIGVQSAQTV
jgi:glycosyltransferase involved in cell wall biosynthesis